MKAFHDYIDRHKDAMIRDLQGCIRIPSVYADDGSGHPYGLRLRECLDYMLALCREKGFDACEMDGQLGWCEFGEGEEMVAVLGHLDVVPEGEGWTVPPFGGDVVDGRIYGRGTMDDKGPLIAALYGLCALKESGLPLKRRIRLIFGLNEETGSADMKYYTGHGGEIPVMGFTPDGEYPIINGEKGLVVQFFEHALNQMGDIRLAELQGGVAHNSVPGKAFARLICPEDIAAQIAAVPEEKVRFTATDDGVLIEAVGIDAHGGSPWEGENAVGRLLLFLNKLPLQGDLKQVVAFLAEKIGMECFGESLGLAMEDAESGKFTMNMGMITGDEKGIEVRVNYRYPVTKSFEDCGPQILAAFEGAGFRQTHLQHKARIYMEEGCPLVQKLLKVYADYTGAPAKAKCIGGGTYAKMMPNILAFGPIFPGDEVREHKPDEFMELERLADNAKILADAMYALATDA